MKLGIYGCLKGSYDIKRISTGDKNIEISTALDWFHKNIKEAGIGPF